MGERVSAMERVLALHDNVCREGATRTEFVGRMHDALYCGHSPGAPLDLLYASGRLGLPSEVQGEQDPLPQEKPAWEPPHYRRPWDVLPTGSLVADPRFHPNYGYGLPYSHAPMRYQREGGMPAAPRFPTDYPVEQIPLHPALAPMGYDPILSAVKDKANAAE